MVQGGVKKRDRCVAHWEEHGLIKLESDRRDKYRSDNSQHAINPFTFVGADV